MDPLIGTILLFAPTYAPVDWMDCYGQVLQVNQYQALYSLVGNMYGGSAPSTFAIPDFRSRVPLGLNPSGTGNNPALPVVTQGQKGGARAITLTVAQLPAHNHTATVAGMTGTVSGLTATLKASQDAAGSGTPQTNSFLAHATDGNTDYPIYNGGTGTLVNLGGLSVSGNVTLSGGTVAIGNTGANAAIDITPAYLGMRYIICVNGIYPMRP